MEELEKRMNGNDLQKRYSLFINIMRKAVNIASGRKDTLRRSTSPTVKQGKSNKQQVRWWDAECSEVIEMRKKKLKIYKKLQTLHSFIEYKKHVAIARRVIRKKKRENFKNFCNSISRYTSLTYVWNIMRTLKKSRNKVNWNKWQLRDREKAIREEIDKLSVPGVSWKKIEDKLL